MRTHRPHHIRNIIQCLRIQADQSNPRCKAAVRLRMAARERKWVARVPAELRGHYMPRSVAAARELITLARIANLSAPSRLPS